MNPPDTPADDDGWRPPHRPISAWGQEADRKLDELKAELRELQKSQNVTMASSQQNGWEISQLKVEVSGLKAKVDRIAEVLPDMKITRGVVFGLVGLVLTGVAGAFIRGIHW